MALHKNVILLALLSLFSTAHAQQDPNNLLGSWRGSIIRLLTPAETFVNTTPVTWDVIDVDPIQKIVTILQTSHPGLINEFTDTQRIRYSVENSRMILHGNDQQGKCDIAIAIHISTKENQTFMLGDHRSTSSDCPHMLISMRRTSEPFLQSTPKEQPIADPLTEGAALLFKGIDCNISNADKNYIFRQTGFVKSSDPRYPFIVKGGEEDPFSAPICVTDLNADGIEEVFICYGNIFTSGRTGSDIVLYIKNSNTDSYRKNLGFPGLFPDVLSTRTNGYPDLVIGMAGMEFPIYSWNGSTYKYKKGIGDSAIRQLKLKSVVDIGKSNMTDSE